MNPLPPNVDELVSAYLDGEAAPDEVVTVESSPELMERVEQMRSLARQLGAPISPALETKEAHISAALDAFDALFAADPVAAVDSTGPKLTAVPTTASGDGESPAVADEVVSFEAARARRRPRRFNTGVIAAAAAVMLLFVAAATLSFGRGNSSEDVATSADDSAQSAPAADIASEADVPNAAAGNALREVAPQQAPPAAAMLESAEDAAADDDEGGDVAADALEYSAESLAAEPVDEEDSFAANDARDDGDAAADDAAADDAMAGADAEADMADDDDAMADDGEFLEGQLYFVDLGRFENRAAFVASLEDSTLGELVAQASDSLPGLRLPCQDTVQELADVEPVQLLVEAQLDEEGPLVSEIFVDITPDGSRQIYVVDSADCALISVVERP